MAHTGNYIRKTPNEPQLTDWQNHCPRTHIPILRILPRHQRMHQETQQQTPRLRQHAVQSQETRRKAR